MKTLTYAAVALAVIAGAAPARAQFYQPAGPDAPIAAPAQSPAMTGAVDAERTVPRGVCLPSPRVLS